MVSRVSRQPASQRRRISSAVSPATTIAVITDLRARGEMVETVLSVTIVKDTVPNDAQDFGFSGSFGTFSLDDDSDPTLSNTATFGSLVPGQYSVTETTVAGWDLTNISCDDSRSATASTGVGATATINVDPGEDVTCTFVNDDDAPSLTLVKQLTKNNGGTAAETDWLLAAAGRPGLALALLTAYSWPGNVRELQNEAKKALALSDDEIHVDDLGSPGCPHRLGGGAARDQPVRRGPN